MHLERGYLYQHAYDWLSRDKGGATITPDSEEINRLFIHLWKCKIQDCMDTEKVWSLSIAYTWDLVFFLNLFHA